MLTALDRLEVRGRDSAGIHFLLGVGRRSPPPPGSSATRARARRRVDVRSAVRRRARCASLDGGAARSLVYKAAAEIGELGDNGRRLRRSLAGDSVLRAALSPRRRRRCRSRPHPLGVGGHHQRGQRSSAQSGRGSPRGRAGQRRAALRGRRAQRRRRQLRRAARRRRPAHRRRDHHRRQDHPDAGGAPPRARRAGGRGVPADGVVVPRLGRDRGAERDRARSRSCSRCAAAARRSTSASRTACSWWRASPTGWSSRPRLICGSTARRRAIPRIPTASRGQIVVLDRRRAGTLEGIRRIAYDGTELPVRSEELLRAEVTTRDIHRGDHPALPAQGDLAGARLVPQDAARQDPRRGRAAARRSRRGDAAGEAARAAALGRHPPPGGDRPGHGGGGGPGGRRRDHAPAARGSGHGARDAGDRALRLQPAARHERHAGRSPSASRAPPPTPTARSISRAVAAPPCSRWSTVAAAIWSRSRTASSSPRTDATSR